MESGNPTTYDAVKQKADKAEEALGRCLAERGLQVHRSGMLDMEYAVDLLVETSPKADRPFARAEIQVTLSLDDVEKMERYLASPPFSAQGRPVRIYVELSDFMSAPAAARVVDAIMREETAWSQTHFVRSGRNGLTTRFTLWSRLRRVRKLYRPHPDRREGRILEVSDGVALVEEPGGRQVPVPMRHIESEFRYELRRYENRGNLSKRNLRISFLPGALDETDLPMFYGRKIPKAG